MGALIFYIVIHLIGYYAAHLFNQAIGHVSIRNHRITGLVLVLTVGKDRGYKIMSASPPHDHDDGAGACVWPIRHYPGRLS